METFLRDLLAHSEWANAVFFQCLGPVAGPRPRRNANSLGPYRWSSARVLIDLTRGAAGRAGRWATANFRGSESARCFQSRGPGRVCCRPQPRSLIDNGAHPVVSGSALRHQCCGGPGPGKHAHSASSRSVHDPAEGLWRGSQKR